RLALPVEVQVFHRDPGTGRGAKRGRSELNHGGTGRETTSLRLKSGAGADVISHSDQCRISWQTPSHGNDDGPSGEQDRRGNVDKSAAVVPRGRPSRTGHAKA